MTVLHRSPVGQFNDLTTDVIPGLLVDSTGTHDQMKLIKVVDFQWEKGHLTLKGYEESLRSLFRAFKVQERANIDGCLNTTELYRSFLGFSQLLLELVAEFLIK